jgi:hypothetical protein
LKFDASNDIRMTKIVKCIAIIDISKEYRSITGLGSFSIYFRGRRDRGRMVVGFTTTCAISVYHHLSCEFEPRSWRGVLYTTMFD